MSSWIAHKIFIDIMHAEYLQPGIYIVVSGFQKRVNVMVLGHA